MSKKILSLLLSVLLMLSAAAPAWATGGTSEVTVTFRPNGGKITGQATSDQYVHTYQIGQNTPYGTLPTADREGHTFDGWFTNATGGTQIESTTTVKTDVTELFAHWSIKKYTITLQAGQGTFSDGTKEKKLPVDHGKTYASAIGNTVPSFLGYRFTGWSNGTSDSADKDATFTAQWEPINLTINYDPNGGSPTPSPVTVTPASDGSGYTYPTPPADPSRDYHTPQGWFTAPSGGTKVNGGEAFTPPSGSTTITLYAQWERNKRTFKLHTVPGTDGKYTADSATWKEITVLNGTTFDDIETPTRAGYGFAGWCSDTDLSTLLGKDTVDPSKNIITAINPANTVQNLYAKWTKGEYTVTLDLNYPNAPTPTPFADKVTFGGNYSAILQSTAPTRTGYTFRGWYTAATGGDKIESTTTVTATQDHTLYAQWEAKKIKVRLNYNYPADAPQPTPTPTVSGEIEYGAKYGSAIPNVDPKDIYPSSSPSASPSPTPLYKFGGWYTTAEDKPTASPPVEGKEVTNESFATEDTTEVGDNLYIDLYARWKYDVAFYLNVPTASPSPGAATPKPTPTPTPYATKTYWTGKAYGSFPSDPPPQGDKRFNGWYTDKDCKNPVKETDVMPAASNTAPPKALYAGWGDRMCSITLDLNGGTMPGTDPVLKKSILYGQAYGDFISEKDTDRIPTRTGATFAGWYTTKTAGSTGDMRVTADSKVTGDCTLYARWSTNQVTLTMDHNYTSGPKTTKSVDYNTKLGDALPTADPTRTGYAFEGWFYDEECKRAVKNSEVLTADLTIYALWVKSEEVRLELDGGSLPTGTPSYINAYKDGKYKLPTPKKTGYKFEGWYTGKEDGRKVENGGTVDMTGDKPTTPLYARWTARKVTVVYNLNGAPGDPRTPSVYNFGENHSKLPRVVTWTGHIFRGWYTAATGGTQVTNSTPVTVASDEAENLTVTVYAQWGFQVSFDPGTGSGDMDPAVAPMNQPYTLPACTFTPPEGMRFGGWAIGDPKGVKQPSGSTYNVTRQTILYATWTNAPITITATCTTGGSLATETGSTNQVTVERGQDVTFLARANTGYVLKNLVVDGESMNFYETYTFRNVTEDHTIHAVFEREGEPGYISCDHGVSCPLSRYVDLNANDWYHDAVHFCIDNVIMRGESESRGIYHPNYSATRATVAEAMWNAAGRPLNMGSGVLSKTYNDVSPQDWYYRSIEWATSQGILRGYDNGNFGPNDYITREQLVTILWRHAGKPRARQSSLNFYDAARVSDYAWDAMLWATEQKIIKGREHGYLVPKGRATRAEVAQMLKNYMG